MSRAVNTLAIDDVQDEPAACRPPPVVATNGEEQPC